MDRKLYIAALHSHFTGPFLAGLAAGNSSILSELERCRCKIGAGKSRISVEFQLGSIFDTLWHHANSNGIDLPTKSDWDKDFKEFCHQLMNPWPTAKFAASGFQVSLLHKSNCHERHVYELTST